MHFGRANVTLSSFHAIKLMQMLDYIRVDHFLSSPFNRIQIIKNRDMQRVLAFDNDPSYNISKKVGVSNIKLSSNIWSTFTWLMDFTLHLFSQATKQALIHRPAAFLRQVSRELQAASKIYPVGKLLVIAMRLLHFFYLLLSSSCCTDFCTQDIP